MKTLNLNDLKTFLEKKDYECTVLSKEELEDIFVLPSDATLFFQSCNQTRSENNLCCSIKSIISDGANFICAIKQGMAEDIIGFKNIYLRSFGPRTILQTSIEDKTVLNSRASNTQKGKSSKDFLVSFGSLNKVLLVSSNSERHFLITKDKKPSLVAEFA